MMQSRVGSGSVRAMCSSGRGWFKCSVQWGWGLPCYQESQ